MLTKPSKGFVLGKFMPPHLGHVYMCDFAAAYCEDLTILVCSLAQEPIPGVLRYNWMRQLFPHCNVVWCNENLPQEPKDSEDFWQIWKDVVRRYGGQPDVVFASELYGIRLAHEVQARFVPVDIERNIVPVSGTNIRLSPFKFWKFIPNIVRPYYAKRICLFGPESTGKSTLAKQLSVTYDTILVSEYGRTYTDVFGVEIRQSDIEAIVSGHMASVAAAKRHANRLIIEDTDPLMSAVWSDMLLGSRSQWFAQCADYADLYLLCDIDLPWVDDGTRYFPAPDDRKRFFELCKQELEARGVPYAIIGGANDLREKAAVNAILSAFPEFS